MLQIWELFWMKILHGKIMLTKLFLQLILTCVKYIGTTIFFLKILK